MLGFIGFILLLALVVAVGPLAAVVLGTRHDRRDGPGRMGMVNLPGRLLAARRRPFRVEGCDGGERAPRVYMIPATHAGAATMKARNWGMTIRNVGEMRGEMRNEEC